jgi:CTP synthase
MNVIEKERKGDFLGGTIQVIPHITNEIKRCILLVARETSADVVIVEVGGTVGDIEGQPFLEAIRQLRSTLARDDSLFIHVTFLPYIGATEELKTKPTQHSVRELRSTGIQPQVIIARTDHEVSKEVCAKIALFCDVDERAVVPLLTTNLLYEVPLTLEDTGLGDYIVTALNLPNRKAELGEWREMIGRMRGLKDTGVVRVGIVGKYVELHDAYMSVKEALFHAATDHNHRVEIEWIYSGDLEREKAWDELRSVDAIVVPGGFGYRGVEGKVLAARYAREQRVPYLGLCLGMQTMCIEFGRNVLGFEDANSAEFDATSEHKVIDLMLEQRGVTDLGGTMRLGLYPCILEPGTAAASAYGAVGEVKERHRHRFEFNNEYRETFIHAGMIFSGVSPDGRLVEIAEVKDHPFMVGSQFHPEFLSRPNAPHPLFRRLIGAAIEHKKDR